MRYRNGVNRYFKELDIIKILKTIRASKLLFKSLMNTRERILLQMQRAQVVSSCSDDKNTSNDDVKDLGSIDPLSRVWALGKIQRALKGMPQQKLKSFDKRLLKGFYVNNQHELECEMNEGTSSVRENEERFAKIMKYSKFEKSLKGSMALRMSQIVSVN